MEDHNSSEVDESEMEEALALSQIEEQEDEEWKNHEAQQYSDFCNILYSPENWYSHARSLYAAAKQTWKRIEELDRGFTRDKEGLERVYFMLAGMSIEALLKTNIITRIPEEQRTSPLPKKIKTHDLLKLAAILDLELNEDERFCLKNLTDFIVWAGRYPVPANTEDYGIVIVLDHKEIFEALFKKLSIPYDITS